MKITKKIRFYPKLYGESIFRVNKFSQLINKKKEGKVN